MKDHLNWGIIGPGTIARAFAGGLAHSKTGRLVAIASRNPRPELAAHFPGIRCLTGYEALLADPEIDAVYIATPHTEHAEWAIKAARAGKHALVEKPITLSAMEADALYHEAAKAGVFMGEAYMYRLHPLTQKLIDMVKEGAVGEVRMIRSSFGFDMGEVVPGHRLFSADLAGGGILDVGGYPVSMARLIAGAAAGRDYLDPVRISGSARIGETGADEWAAAILTFENGIVAEVACSIRVQQDNVLWIMGSKGRIAVKDFWFATGREGGTMTIELYDGKAGRTEIPFSDDGWLYAYEADAVHAALAAGRTGFAAPGMSQAESVANMRVLDHWRDAAGLVYPFEKAAPKSVNIRGEKVVAGNGLEKRTIPGLSKPVSGVALGFEYFETLPSASVLLDAFYEAGGNLFDTAYIYGGGLTEAIFGGWLKSRGIDRESVAVIGKGVHSPLCYPDVIASQLEQSLERMGTDYVDVYFMHRDNPDIPVDEFVDAMDEQAKAGRIRGIFGGSNWTKERLSAAVDYARRNGRTAPSAVSNNFALAEMVDPVWAGCVTSSTPDWRAWLETEQMPVFSWSSQGRGFFVPDDELDPANAAEVRRCWHSPKNLARRERAFALARELGCHPVQVAFAYLKTLPFPVVPLIGPRRVSELESSLAATEIRLTPEQGRWLEEG
ncbi:aldo/keto reductase [Martelella endophytica]|uniref:Oxidoreductase n=1 Tax=Martelella endophytica TaxID=1486262 RepID=A0A0D5LNY7_MAREN|nr:aldo/keto reductase [Martelella endophytica]AJY45934.1 oxidoreductase [Martelella endophytica]